MIGNLMRGWARGRYRREAQDTLDHLKSLDTNGIGLVLAICIHQRNSLRSEGVDLSALSDLAKARPMYQYELSKAVKALAKSERPHDALGLQVWIHSLRAVQDSSLNAEASDIWQELNRGHSSIARARELVREETGFELDIRHATDVPKEFSIRE